MRALAALVLCLVIASTADGQYDTLSPAAVSDINGNAADSFSNITWGPFPPGQAYEDPGAYDSGGLQGLIDLAKSFINTVQKFDQDLMIEIFVGLKDGDMSFLTGDIMGFVMQFIGIIVCVVLGLLYILFVPLVGCCFCCCRCCCRKCGGDLRHRKGKNDNLCCVVWTFIVLITTIFMAAGAFCTYSAGNQLTKSFDTMVSAAQNNIENIEKYANNTIEEIDYLALDNFDFIADVVIRDLDNIGYLIGVPVRDDFETSGGVNNVVSSVITLDQTLQSVGSALLAVNSSIGDLKVKANALSSALAAVAQKVDTAKADSDCAGCATLDTSVLVMDFDPSSLPDLSTQVADIQSAMATNLTEVALEAQQGVRDIPETVHNETETVVNDLKTLINDFKTTLDTSLGNLSDVTDGLTDITDGLDDSIDEVVDMVQGFDQYRQYVGLGLASITIIVVFLQTLGVLLGCFCYRKNAVPTERNCGSNCAAILLFAALAVIYLISWLLMLVTFILFIIGAPLQVYVCGPLLDPDFSILRQTIDEPGLIFDDYPLGSALLGNGSIPLTISDTLVGCRENGAVWDVLMLEYNTFFNISEVTSYRDDIDIDSEINSINVDLTHLEILSTSTVDQLNDFKSAVNIDFNAFATELAQDTTSTNLSAYAENLRSLASASTNNAQVLLIEAADDIDSIEADEFPAVMNAQSSLLSDIQSLNFSTVNVDSVVDALIAAGNVTDQYIQTTATAVIQQEATNFANRMFYSMDQFVDYVVDSLENEVAKCRPLYDIYDSLLGTVVCRATIEILNAFWISMGWSIMFMFFSLIFNVKLAKYFRRMRSCDGYDDVSERAMESGSPVKGPNENDVPMRGLFPRRKHHRSQEHHRSPEYHTSRDYHRPQEYKRPQEYLRPQAYQHPQAYQRPQDYSWSHAPSGYHTSAHAPQYAYQHAPRGHYGVASVQYRLYPTTQPPPRPAGAGPPRISSNKVGHFDH